MKSFPKILIIIFLSIFILQLGGLLILITLPRPSQAAQAKFAPQVDIPGMSQEFGGSKDGYVIPGSTEGIAKYIKVIYRFAIGIVGILAAIVLMVGGVLWIVAGGNATQIGEAKAWIGAALTGLILALTSYLILATVNPALVDLKITQISPVSEIKTGSCYQIEKSKFEKEWAGKTCINFSTEKECTNIGGFFEEGKKCPESGRCYARRTEDSILVCFDGKSKEACEDLKTENGYILWLPHGTCLKSCCEYRKWDSTTGIYGHKCDEGLTENECLDLKQSSTSYMSKGFCNAYKQCQEYAN